MAGWHHRLNGHEFEWTPGVGDGQGSLACCNSWGRKESDTTEQLTELNWIFHYIYVYMYQLLYLFICWWTSRLFQCLPAATKSLHLCLTLCDPHRWQPIRLRHPWDSPGKNTGVGCHFLLQKKTWKTLKCILLTERSQSEKVTYGMVLTKWKGKTVKIFKKKSVVDKGMMNRCSREDFQGSENTVHDNIMMDICYYTFV